MTFHLHEIVDCITQIRGVYRQTGDHNFLHMTRSDKGADREDYIPKWSRRAILWTLALVVPIAWLAWYTNPRIVYQPKFVASPPVYIPTYEVKYVT